jgi:hypothetical protein
MDKTTDIEEINQLMLAKLADSDLDAEDAKALGYKPLTGDQVAELLGHERGRYGFQLPYYDIDGKPTELSRIRYLEDPPKKATLKKKKAPKYTQPPDMPPQLYMPTIGTPWHIVADDIEVPVIITEGELKAACACKHRYPAIALGGVWSFRSKKAKIPLIKDFDKIVWKKRRVDLVFDSDLRSNKDVKNALNALSQELARLGAEVYISYLPEVTPDGKTGLDDFITIKGPDALEDVLCKAEPYSMSEELWKLNNEVVFITNPGFVVVQDTGQVMSPADFKSAIYANRKYREFVKEGHLIEKSTAAEWLAWRHRFELDTLTYAPGKDTLYNNSLNTWPGWGVEPKRGNIKPWRDLMDLIFKSNKDARQWFERWCAYQFQHPGVKIFSAVLFWGVLQGTGKSLVGQTLGKIFGQNYAEIGNAELHGNNNYWARNKQFILIDEIASVDKRERWGDTELLKKLVTQETIHINEKYVKNYDLPDCIAYFMTSNNPDALRIALEDRRFFVWELRVKESMDFYLDFIQWRDEEEGAAALFYHFLHLDLGDFNPKRDALVTESKLEMGEASRTPTQHWIHTLLDDPDSVIGFNGMSTSDLYTSAQLLAMYNADSNNMPANWFGRELKKARLEPRQITIDGKKFKLYAVRNIDFWERAKVPEWRNHYKKFFLNDGEPKQKVKKAKF